MSKQPKHLNSRLLIFKPSICDVFELCETSLCHTGSNIGVYEWGICPDNHIPSGFVSLGTNTRRRIPSRLVHDRLNYHCFRLQSYLDDRSRHLSNQAQMSSPQAQERTLTVDGRASKKATDWFGRKDEEGRRWKEEDSYRLLKVILQGRRAQSKQHARCHDHP